MKILLFLLLTTFSTYSQVARPTYNPFNNSMMMPQYQRPIPSYGYGMQNNYGTQQFNNPYGMQQFFQQPQFPNNTNHPLNFHRPNDFGYQNNFQQQPQQATPLPTPLFTRRFHLNNGYLFGRPTLYLDPKTGKMQPWVRKNLR